MAKGESMTTRQEEVLNLSALYLHIYDKLYFFLDDPVKIFVCQDIREEEASESGPRPTPPPPFLFAFLMMFGFVYLLFMFS